MNRSLWIKLALFLVPGLAGLLFLLSWLNPEKKIIRRADAIFATAERSGINLAGAEDKVATFNTLTAPTFEIAGPDPIPTGTIGQADAAGLLVEFHESILSCAISRGEPSVAFPAKDVARLKCDLEANVNAGGGLRSIERFSCQMEFRRTGGGWLLTKLVLSPL